MQRLIKSLGIILFLLLFFITGCAKSPSMQPSNTTGVPSTAPIESTSATEAATLTVFFHANGGSVSPASNSCSQGSTYGMLPTPERSGYTFAGWFTAADGGTQILSDSPVESDADHTLYAKWMPQQFTVTFYTDGDAAIPAQIQVAYDSVYGELPFPTKPGYQFIGWFTQDTGGDKILPDTVVRTEKDITLYAQWETNNCTVTLQANGGNLTTDRITVIENSPYGTLPTPTKSGYTFAGWYTVQTGGTQVSAATIVSSGEDHTLYAQWTANTYTLALNANGGNVTTGQLSITFDKPYGNLPIPTRNGYTFAGWYTAQTGGTQAHASNIVSSVEDHTLYAHWAVNTYTVHLDACGGSGISQQISVAYGESYGTLPVPSREGFTFNGWFTSAEGGTPVTANSVMSTDEDHTLYAHWTAKPKPPAVYTVTFDPNGGIVKTATRSYKEGISYGMMPTPTREGYTFDGWFNDPVDGTMVTSGTKVSLCDHTLYAHWTAKPTIPPEDTDGRFSFAVIPDTQQEVVVTHAIKKQYFLSRSNWLLSQREALDLRFALHTGDVVNWGDADESQLVIASNAMKPLDDAGLPVLYALGNHDTAAVGVGGSAAVPSETKTRVRDTSAFNKYFSTDRYPELVTKDKGVIDNAYFLTEAGGVKWMILTLELWPRTEVVNWAKNVVSQHPEHNVIVITHSYMTSSGAISDSNGGYGANSPMYLYNNLISRYENIKMVFCGHTGKATHRIDTGIHGNKILSVLACFHSNESNPVRIIDVDTVNGTVGGWIYSPVDKTEWTQYRFQVSGMEFIKVP